MGEIRTFIAIEIPSIIKEKICELQRKLKEEQAQISWIKPENIHITLKFLGNIDENRITNIAKAIEITVQKIESFSIEIKGVGAFPNYKKPKVIWIGADSDKNLLIFLAQQIDEEIHKLGFKKENRLFKAHLTIGRVKMIRGVEGVIKKLEQNNNFNAGSFITHEIVIVRSDLKPTGAVYTPLKKLLFNKLIVGDKKNGR